MAFNTVPRPASNKVHLEAATEVTEAMIVAVVALATTLGLGKTSAEVTVKVVKAVEDTEEEATAATIKAVAGTAMGAVMEVAEEATLEEATAVEIRVVEEGTRRIPQRVAGQLR